MFVTRFGVSLLNVVATIESPANYHGTERPEAKNSDVFFPALLSKNRAGTKQIRRETIMIIQSKQLQMHILFPYLMNGDRYKISLFVSKFFL